MAGQRTPQAMVLGVGLLAGALAAGGADWPQWGRTNDRNMVSPERGLVDGFDPGGKGPGRNAPVRPARNVKWTAPLGSEVYGNLAVAEGRVFIGTNNAANDDPRFPGDRDVLLCLEEGTGKRLWQLAVPKGKNSGLPKIGLCSHPTVDGDRVYVVTNRLEVLCLDVHGMTKGNQGPFQDEGQYLAGEDKPPIEMKPGDADILWKVDTLSQFKMVTHDCASGSVLILGDLAYVPLATANPKKAPNPGPTLLVLDKMTGRIVARENEGVFPYHNQWSSPAAGKIGGQTLVFFGGDNGVFYAFDAQPVAPAVPGGPGDGKIGTLKTVWTFDCYKAAPPRADAAVESAAGPTTKPAKPIALEIYGTPVFYKNRVYFTLGRDPTLGGLEHGRLYCLDAARTGDITASGLLWSFDAIACSISTVAIADGLLYVEDELGNIYCLDAETGELLWKHKVKQQIWDSALVADGKVYIGAGRGRGKGGGLLVFAAGREKKLLSEVELDGAVCVSPVAANGVLYLGSNGMLYALQSPQ